MAWTELICVCVLVNVCVCVSVSECVGMCICACIYDLYHTQSKSENQADARHVYITRNHSTETRSLLQLTAVHVVTGDGCSSSSSSSRLLPLSPGCSSGGCSEGGLMREREGRGVQTKLGE